MQKEWRKAEWRGDNRTVPYKCKVKQREWFKARRILIRGIIARAKAVPCLDCKVLYPTCVMQFDHVRGKKCIALGSATARIRSVNALYEEIAKCEVVCANCHALRTDSREAPSNGA